MEDDRERLDRLHDRLEALDALATLIAIAVGEGEDMSRHAYGFEVLMRDQVVLLRRDALPATA